MPMLCQDKLEEITGPSVPSAVSSELRSIETSQQDTDQAGKNDQLQNADKETRAASTLSLPSYSNAMLISLQKSDPAINSFLNYWQRNQRPNAARRIRIPENTRVLLKRWNKMTVQDGLLYRLSRNTQQEEDKQLVLPVLLTDKVLESLRNDMGHQGLERTLLLARNRFYWPGIFLTPRSGSNHVSDAFFRRCHNLGSEHRWET